MTYTSRPPGLWSNRRLGPQVQTDRAPPPLHVPDGNVIRQMALTPKMTLSAKHPNAPPPPPQFFVDHKRGEVNELRQLLRSVQTERDDMKKREAIKKVIAYMTLGIDVSRLFSEMIMASSTTDLVQKKMIYLYLTNYAESNRELTILAINTFLKDCRDDDPTIRGLAIRSLCSLKLSNITEYVEPAIRKGLKDPNTYVRKTSVLGVLKLLAIQPDGVSRGDFVDLLYSTLYDEEPLVATNSIYALNEILADEGGILLTQDLVAHLVNRMKYFNEWGQCAILTLLANYIASSAGEDEMFDLMNILEDRLKQASVSIVLGCAKCFIEITRSRPDLTRQVLFRLKDPFITLMSTSSQELSYTVLAHIRVLTSAFGSDASEALGEDFKIFFCRYNDPSYTKTCKLDILTHLAAETNVGAIQSELEDYVTDVDAEIAKKSILALGTIAVKIPRAAESILSQLLSFLSYDVTYVTTATLVVLKDLLRRFPEYFPSVISVVTDLFKSVSTTDEPEGLCALLWMIGECTEADSEAPYMLELLAHHFHSPEYASSTSLKMAVLTCAMRLFLKFPPEVQKTLGQVLEKAHIEHEIPEVRDRALMYYRLLMECCRTGSLDEAKRIVLVKKDIISERQNTDDVEKADRLMLEFNTLSIMYGQPAAKFVVAKQIPFGGHVDASSCRVDGGSGTKGNAALHLRDAKHPTSDIQLQLTTSDTGDPENGATDQQTTFDDFTNSAEDSTTKQLPRRARLLTDDSWNEVEDNHHHTDGTLHNDAANSLVDRSTHPSLITTTSPPSAASNGSELIHITPLQPTTDALQGFLTGDETRANQSRSEAKSSISADDLDETIILTPSEFAAQWARLPVITSFSEKSLAGLQKLLDHQPITSAAVENILVLEKIRCMASGPIGSLLKFFFFSAEKSTKSMMYVEVQIETREPQSMRITVKADGQLPATQKFAQLFLSFLCKSLGY